MVDQHKRLTTGEILGQCSDAAKHVGAIQQHVASYKEEWADKGTKGYVFGVATIRVNQAADALRELQSAVWSLDQEMRR